MNWIDSMNQAIRYMEDHMEGKMDYAKVAQAACSSVYHFQRMFTYMTNVPLAEYVRRRKMTLAAFELQRGAPKVIDLALRFGYESPEAFTRAFQSFHGITPTAARKFGAPTKAFPRISFQLTIKGASEMNYKIVQHPAFQVYGMERIFDSAGGENLKDIPAFWTETFQDGSFERLMYSANIPGFVNGLCGYREMEGTKFPYMLCTVKTPLSDTDGYTVVDIPAATWAVFKNEPHATDETKDAVQSLISRVYSDWLPTAQYDMVGGYDFEFYFGTLDEKCYEEVWFRVIPKK